MCEFGVVVIAENIRQRRLCRMQRVDVCMRIDESHRLQGLKNFSDQTLSHRWETFNGNLSLGIVAQQASLDADAGGWKRGQEPIVRRNVLGHSAIGS